MFPYVGNLVQDHLGLRWLCVRLLHIEGALVQEPLLCVVSLFQALVFVWLPLCPLCRKGVIYWTCMEFLFCTLV